MNKTGMFLSICLTAVALALPARAQELIKVKTPVAAAVTEQTPDERIRDAFHSEEARVCSELRSFAVDNVFADENFMTAAKNRNTRHVVRAAAKYATALAKNYDADFMFYHPNTRFFVRVNDKNYRGRMRLSSDFVDSSSACFWERLPSQDVVYSVLMKINAEKAGYLKISKKLTKMVVNMPDALAAFGKVRLYTALDKTGLKKMAWFKMRRREPERCKFSGWCAGEDLAFLTSVGQGRVLSRKQQKTLLSTADKNPRFDLPELGISGGVMNIAGYDGQRLAALVYTTDAQNVEPVTEENEDPENDENAENILYRHFE